MHAGHLAPSGTKGRTATDFRPMSASPNEPTVGAGSAEYLQDPPRRMRLGGAPAGPPRPGGPQRPARTDDWRHLRDPRKTRALSVRVRSDADEVRARGWHEGQQGGHPRGRARHAVPAATKAQPKEMLPVVDKPAIQYVVEEAVRRGHRPTSSSSPAGQARDRGPLRPRLRARVLPGGRRASTTSSRRSARSRRWPTIHYIRQGEPLGLGHAVAVGRAARRRRAVRGAAGRRPHDRRLEAAAAARCSASTSSYGRSVDRRCRRSRRDEISLYGCIEPEFVERATSRASSTIVEKPPPEDAPSNLAASAATCSRPRSSTRSSRRSPGVGGEIQLTDAINLLAQEQAVYGVRVRGRAARRREQARLPEGDRRARHRPRGRRAGLPRLPRRLRPAQEVGLRRLPG